MDKNIPKLDGIASQILKAEALELNNVANRIDESVVRAAKIILAHDGKVIVCGVGKSGLLVLRLLPHFAARVLKLCFCTQAMPFMAI